MKPFRYSVNVGDKFGALTVIGAAEKHGRYIFHKVKCACGKEFLKERSDVAKHTGFGCLGCSS